MISGRSHITVMVLALVRDSRTWKLRAADGGPIKKQCGYRGGGGGGGGGREDERRTR